MIESAGAIELTVTRSNGSQGSVSVKYATVEGSARPGEDYTPVSGTLTFAEGETVKTITLWLIDDFRAEPDETLKVTLAGPTGGAVLGNIRSLTVNIIDDPTDVVAGDVNNDRTVDLADAILCLQLLSGASPKPVVDLKSDINEDGAIGMEEAIFILYEISGMR